MKMTATIIAADSCSNAGGEYEEEDGEVGDIGEDGGDMRTYILPFLCPGGYGIADHSNVHSAVVSGGLTPPPPPE